MSEARLNKSRQHQRPPPHRSRSWCCSFAAPPHSPDNLIFAARSASNKPPSSQKNTIRSLSFPNSPQSQSGSKANGVSTRIVPRRIRSPGRVSPMESLDENLVQNPAHHSHSLASSSIETAKSPLSRPECEASSSALREEEGLGIFDTRLSLRGKNGMICLLEVNSEVLAANSSVFADLVAEYRKKSKGLCRLEVPNVENLGVFQETVELMFEKDIPKRLLKIGVYRTIDVLEVSAGLKFTRGVVSCLEYIEAMPWTEEEDGKLRSLFGKLKIDDETAGDIMARLYVQDSPDCEQKLASSLVLSVTSCRDVNARNELKPLVKGLVCEKDHCQLNKEDILGVCRSCLGSLVSLLEEATSDGRPSQKGRPLIERISNEVDNMNWLLEILVDRHMGEDLVDMWTHQVRLLHLHKCASPMVRYELSRVSAKLFVAIGTGKMHCRPETRLGLMQAWFRPMLSDFGWLQRCKKGLDMKAVEEAMGQSLLTLPLKEQYVMFMEWFQCFSKNGTECPNLSKAFQVWWRRSLLNGSECRGVECR